MKCGAVIKKLSNQIFLKFQVDTFFKKAPLKDEVKKAELRLCSFLSEHNIPFRAMDHLSDVLVKCFTDSDIAKEFSCKRSKAAAITYNVLGPNFEKDMIEDILGTASPSGKPVYSIIIDESTDVATVKVLAIVIKYFSETKCTVQTKFLDLVDLSGETAGQLFNSLSSKLSELGLEIKDVIGFAADTTNVMFGQHSGIVAKIKEVNPKCFFIKCVCHSAALSVSHACKILPRNLEQIVKEVYGYFSQSSKRQREFAEFQNFTDTENHRILRHYDIRWLSLHACISRIIEQWRALQLFFQDQYLSDRNMSSEFLFNSFTTDINKLYFYFLDYILPIVNKFNIIFQGDYPCIDRLYDDASSMYLSILGCFMKANYIKRTDNVFTLDPKSNVNYLPLKDMYLGIQVGQELIKHRENLNMKEQIAEFFRRCQSFLIELSTQLKSRLPFENPVFRELKFLNPHTAVHKEFRSLRNVIEAFPCEVQPEQMQLIDEEYRTLKFDREVSDLLQSSSTGSPISCEQFWVEVGKISNSDGMLKYKNITSFSKSLLCIPVSNAACERIFSQINLIKTDQRNRFINKNVSAILKTKQGVKDEGGCVNFNPSKRMLKYNSNIYCEHE